jgi:hypothetical protein
MPRVSERRGTRSENGTSLLRAIFCGDGLDADLKIQTQIDAKLNDDALS